MTMQMFGGTVHAEKNCNTFGCRICSMMAASRLRSFSSSGVRLAAFNFLIATKVLWRET